LIFDKLPNEDNGSFSGIKDFNSIIDNGKLLMEFLSKLKLDVYEDVNSKTEITIEKEAQSSETIQQEEPNKSHELTQESVSETKKEDEETLMLREVVQHQQHLEEDYKNQIKELSEQMEQLKRDHKREEMEKELLKVEMDILKMIVAEKESLVETLKSDLEKEKLETERLTNQLSQFEENKLSLSSKYQQDLEEKDNIISQITIELQAREKAYTDLAERYKAKEQALNKTLATINETESKLSFVNDQCNELLRDIEKEVNEVSIS